MGFVKRRVWSVLLAVFLLFLLPERQTPGRPAQGEAQVDMPMVALTFDDGPRTDATARLLDGLALREAPATFFVVGNRIAGNEDLIRRMRDEGHQIGIHTFDHVEVTKLSRPDFDLQVGKTQALLASLTGEGEFWLRPPYGKVDDSVRQWTDSPLILWSVDPEDWKDHDVNRIVGHILSHVQDGDIILMHDIFNSSVDAALQAVDALQAQGYCFVTVEQLLEARGIRPQAGELYR